MALVPCPSCGLQRSPADVDISPCPVCGHRPGDPVSEPGDAPASPPPPAESAPVPAADPGRRQNAVLVAAFALIGAGVLAAMLMTQDPPAPPPEPVPVEVPPPPAVEPNPPPVAVVAVAPKPADPEPTGPEVAPRPRPVVFAPVALRIDRPDEDFRVDRVAEGNTLRLTGRARKLTIDGVGGGATVDATGLDVKDVTVAGRVDGGATLRVKARETVNFRAEIEGGATVSIDAGTGTVSFPGGTGSKVPRAVGGGAAVTVAAKTVWLYGPVDGTGTRVDLTLAPGGSAKFAALDGTAVLTYRPSSPHDPPPRMTGGDVRGKAECRRLE